MSQPELIHEAHLVGLKTQQALTESFQQSHGIANAIIEASPVPKMLVNARGEVTYLNRAFIQAFGYELTDIPTLETWWRKAYPQVQERRAGWWLSMVEQFMNGQAQPGQEMRELTCKDGRRRQVLKNAARIALNPDEPSLLVVYNDVTEWFDAHQALQRQHEYLEAILASEPECVKVVSPEGELQQMNPAGLAMLEVKDLEEARAHGLINFIDPPFRQSFMDFHRRVCAGQVGQLEFSITGAKGAKRWMEMHATPLHDHDGSVRLLSVTRDISERKAMEMALADRNHYLWLNNRVLQMLTENAAMNDVLTEMVRMIEHNQPGNLISVLLVDADGQHLVHGAAPSLPQGWIDLIARVPIGDGQGSCGTAAYRGERVIVDDIAIHPYWVDYRAQAMAHDLRACWSHPIKDGKGQVLGTFAVYRQHATHPTAHDLERLEDYAKLASLVIERSKMAEAIHEMAFYDRLTGLPNRRLLEERMKQLISLAQRDHLKMAVLFLDLDKFKQVNDQHGHEAGDWLLQQVSRRMTGVLRQSDTASRVGGDEFVILLPDANTVEGAVKVAEKIRQQMEQPFVMKDGVRLDISSSIGVVMYPDQADNGRDLLRYGDEAMYRAKKRGRNAVEVFAQVPSVTAHSS